MALLVTMQVKVFIRFVGGGLHVSAGISLVLIISLEEYTKAFVTRKVLLGN